MSELTEEELVMQRKLYAGMRWVPVKLFEGKIRFSPCEQEGSIDLYVGWVRSSMSRLRLTRMPRR